MSRVPQVTVPVCVFAFDLLYADGQPLVHLPLRSRRDRLAQVLPHQRPGFLQLAKGIELPPEVPQVSTCYTAPPPTHALPEQAASPAQAGDAGNRQGSTSGRGVKKSGESPCGQALSGFEPAPSRKPDDNTVASGSVRRATLAGKERPDHDTAGGPGLSETPRPDQATRGGEEAVACGKPWEDAVREFLQVCMAGSECGI